MKRQLFYATTAALILAACSEPLQEAVEINTDAQSTNAKTIELSPEELSLVERIANQSPKINQEKAQTSAMNLLGFKGEASTQQMMSEVFCNPKKVYNSLTKSYNTYIDTAFYLFNTPDNNGFAILAADLRVPNQILAYSDNGSFDPNTDNPAMTFFLELAKDYVSECIAKADAQEDSLTESICQKLGIENDTCQHGLKTKSKILQKIKCTTEGLPQYTIVNRGEVKPLINTKWHQGFPFNGKCSPSPAGCAPIAIAQILNYWKAPSVIKGVSVNWNIIQNGYPYNDYTEQVASLINVIRTSVKTDANGGTEINKPLQFFKQIGFSTQSKMIDYNYKSVADALDKSIPVFMGGLLDKGFGGHAWIADGYLIRQVTKNETFKYCIIEELDNGTITDRFEDIPSTTTTIYELLHFNWGWQGNGDGYYNKNIFDTRKQMVSNYYEDFVEIESNVKQHYYFNRDLQIITDIKPR